VIDERVGLVHAAARIAMWRIANTPITPATRCTA
jgi:hypothetical protein